MSQKNRSYLRFLIAAILFAAGGVSGKAQDSDAWKYRSGVMGQAGWGRLYHGDSLLGSGAQFGGGFEFKPFSGKLRRLGFEAQANRVDLNYKRGNNLNEGYATAVVGNVLYHFSDSGIQPYVAGGLGVLNAKYTETIKGGAVLGSTEDYVNHVETRKLMLNIAAGLKARLAHGLALRPEFRFYDTTMGSGYNFAAFQLSVGLAYCW